MPKLDDIIANESKKPQRKSNYKVTNIATEDRPDAGYQQDINEISTRHQELVGYEKSFYDYIKNNPGLIRTKEAATEIGCSYGYLKIIIQRLVRKGVINRLSGKCCPGGGIILETSTRHHLQEIYKDD